MGPVVRDPMSTHRKVTQSERQQTDESLRLEREQADLALHTGLEALEDVADAVITVARQRADAVLAAARARVDGPSGGREGFLLARERAQADQALHRERAVADEVLREERAEQLAPLANERGETDKDLVTERSRADDALAMRDEFLAIVSHDLRTLLNTALGFAGLITQEATREPMRPAQVLSDAQRIQRSGARMNRLIGDLVDVASIHAGTLAVTRRQNLPGEVVQEALDSFQPQAAARGIALVSEVAAPLPALPFDSARIFQVLGNLLSNAVKFTPAQGRVSVRVEPVEGALQFSVRDSGPGIPPDKLEAIFDRYLQVRAGDRRGVGLGLYISRCIVQGHGGRIWAESPRGEGCTVSFTLPRG